MEIRILSEDGEELWATSDSATKRTPSSPREEVFECLITSMKTAFQTYTKHNNEDLDDRSVVITVSEAEIEMQISQGNPPFDFSLHKLH